MAKKKTTTKKKTRASSHKRGFIRRHFLKIALWGMVAACVMMGWLLYDLPNADDVKPLETQAGITVLANDGTLIARYGGMRGDTVLVKDLPPYLLQAVIAIEDRRFYSHFGIDPLGIARAMFVNIKEGGWVQGGSTLTQQLAKNLFLTPDKTLRRKAQEAVLAVWIDWKFSKDEILSAYLNRVYFGSGAYGVDAASRVYFGKPAEKVTLWEGAVLAGLLKAPSRYSPTSNPKLARDRAKVVIGAMEDAGYITKKLAAAELKHPTIELAGAESGDLNRYFADWVIDQIDSYVASSDRDLVVRTTFDPSFQLAAEASFNAMFKSLTPEENITQGAMVTLAKDGAVLSMIGGVSYVDSQYNRATQAMRQPGSSFKPFVYLAALETGFVPSDVIEDSPIRVGKYAPENYDGHYNGPVTLSDALAFSLNAATVRLLSQVGVNKLMDVTQRLGFSMKFKPELATGLGASETTLIELTNAYAVISGGGAAVWPYAVLSIEDAKGHKLYRREDMVPAQVFTTRNMADLDQMLVQVIAKGTGQAAQLSRGHTAGKTGTTQNYRDALFVGYTDNLITGVWMGNDDNAPMHKVSGGKYPARLWHDYMEQAINLTPPKTNLRLPTGGSSGSAGGDFSNMLDRWSQGNLGGFTGNDAPPAYNP